MPDITPDTARHGAPQHDTVELRHTLSIHDVEAQLVTAGVERSHRQVIRYCESGLLDAVKFRVRLACNGTSLLLRFQRRSAISSSGTHNDMARHSTTRQTVSHLKKTLTAPGHGAPQHARARHVRQGNKPKGK